jgi:hypothetical protein
LDDIMVLMALHPPPPTPMILILAICGVWSSISNKLMWRSFHQRNGCRGAVAGDAVSRAFIKDIYQYMVDDMYYSSTI